MNSVNYNELTNAIKGMSVDRPNKESAGTLSGHAAGEPFEKAVYYTLKEKFPNNIFKQYEFLNDLYLKNPHHISYEDRKALFDSPTALFLLSRGAKETKEWSPSHIFEEKQNDTADILFHDNTYFEIIDVKTRNVRKKAQAPNIISAYKLAEMCSYMIDNQEYDNIGIHYIEVDWLPKGNMLKCTTAHHADLFLENPEDLYINWAAAMQIQFHVSDLSQSWQGSKKDWARHYIKTFVLSAKERCDAMRKKFIDPFLKYLNEEDKITLAL